MKDFFKKVLSADSPESSKRFAAFISLFAVIILAFIGTFNKNWLTPDYMYNSLCLIAGGGLTLTVFEKIFNKNGTGQN